MSVATIDETEVLTALDFDAPPVEVMEPKVAEPIKWFVDPAMLGKITWTPIEEFTITADEVAKPAPTFAELESAIAKMFQTYSNPCQCMACKPRQTPKMDRRVRDLWVRALRSHLFPQGRGALRQGDRRCALGVLVEIAIQDGVRMEQAVHPENGAISYDGQYGSLPPAVATWAGLQDADPAVRGQSIAWMNDTGAPFEVLADLIEAGL
jgi:hypothetical protein